MPKKLLLVVALASWTACGGSFPSDPALAGDAQDIDDVDELDEVSDGLEEPPEQLLPDAHTPLRDELHDRIDNHRSLGYKRARTQLFSQGGIYQESSGAECIYTGFYSDYDTTPTPDRFNIEHSWPQSKGAKSEPMKSDLHHLFPSEASANSARGNFPFAMVACAAEDGGKCHWARGGSFRGERIGTDETGFQVRPERRGDIARALFYFAVRYERPINAAEEETLREWHREDPPDAAEVERNARIELVQENRNPFIDEPGYVEQIQDF